MTVLARRLDRTIVIQASPQTVFRFFTDPERWAKWWGPGSTIEPRKGGKVFIRYPEGSEAAGTIVDIDVPRRLSFTYGYVKGTPIPPGASLVTIEIAEHESGARLQLQHEFAEEEVRDEHIQGWRYQLAVFSNIVVDEVNANAGDAVDRWFGAWSETDERARAQSLAAIAHTDVAFRDRFGHTNGLDDLTPHIGAAQRFMPGLRLERRGDVRHCQGTALADWAAVSSDGQTRATGTNVFTFDARGRIRSVTGFWLAQSKAQG